MRSKKRPWNRGVAAPPDRRPPKPERDSAGRVTTHEAAVALARMRGPELAAHIGIKVNACEAFTPYNRQRRRWIKQRMRELADQYGDNLSSGVGARVRSAGWGYAFAEWVSARAAEFGDAGMANLAMMIFKKSSDEDAKARELAECEAKLRKKTEKRLDLSQVLNVGGEETHGTDKNSV